MFPSHDLRPKRPEVVKFEEEKKEFDVETAFKTVSNKGETIPEDKTQSKDSISSSQELEIKPLELKEDGVDDEKEDMVEVEAESKPIETSANSKSAQADAEIIMPKPKTREWLCECGTKLKTGSAKNIKAHTSTQTHRNRMALIGQGLKPEDHMDKVYPNRFKPRTPSETQVKAPRS